MRKLTFLFILVQFLGFRAMAQDDLQKLDIDGELVTVFITEDNDTLLVADLDDVSVSSLRSFKDREEYRRYLKYRRYANVVYPYAVKAIRIFREQEEVINTMKKSKRKKHMKRLQKEMKEEFEKPLKKLTRTQGKILLKMIEKELDTPFYTLVKNLRGTMTASYWNTLGKLYDYQLKEGYIEGQDPILDSVLHDFDVSHDY